MSDFVLVERLSLTVIEVPTGSREVYSLDDTARLADVHPELLRYYCASGLLGEHRTQKEREPVFDDDAIYELRRIEHYRRHHHVNLRALPLVLGLLREIESVRAKLQLLLGR